MKKNIIYGLIIVVISILLDQITKVIMLSELQTEGNFMVVIPDFFKFLLVFNDGAAFSILEGKFGLLMAMTAIATIVFIIMAGSAKFDENPFYSFGIYLMIGGMLGNFIDRVFRPDHKVVDFLSFTFFGNPFATFNIADCCLVIGVILVCVDLLIFESIRKKKTSE